jgi:hypothetical protein
MIGSLYQTPPVSGRDFISYLQNKFHVPGTPTVAYAADPVGGIGYKSLEPVLQIWVVMRNLAYFCFAVIFVVIGIMILIRSKIDPKTTINIQNALPKIILALILVTFSYAIAGFLIDLMYVSIALVLTIVQAMGMMDNGVNVADYVKQNVLSNQTIFHLMLQGSMWYAITSSSAAVGNVVDSLLGMGFGGNVLGFVSSGIALLIITIAILWALFKTWLMLLSAYANIILGIIFSPMQLMLEAIPGQNQFEGWLKNMLANILAFPAVIVMIFLGIALATNMGKGVVDGNAYSGFIPPLIGGNSQVAIQSLIGIAMILTIPKAVEMLQEVLKAPKSKWGSAWGEAVKFGQGVSMAGAGKSYGFGRDYFLGKDTAIFEEARKKYFAGTGPKPAAISRGGVGHALGAKPN